AGGCRQPPLVGSRRIGADGKHLATSLAELRDPTAERGQLGRSDEGKVPRVEKQEEPAVKIVVERDLPRSAPGPVNAKKGKVRRSCPHCGIPRCHRFLLPIRYRTARGR